MCVDKVSDIPIVGPFISKPARMLPGVVSGLATGMNIGPTMTNILGTATGAGQGLTTGLWGQRGAGSALKGGAMGFLQAPVGRGVASGINSYFNPAQQTAQLSSPIMGNTTVPIQPQRNIGDLWSGFKTGFGEAVPFKNQINSILGNQLFTGQGVKQMGGGMPMTGGTKEQQAQQLQMQQQQQMNQGKTNLTKQLLTTMIPSIIPQPKYDVPSAVDVYSSLKNQNLTAATPEGQAAANKLKEYIENPQAVAAPNMDAYKQAITQNYDTGRQREIEQWNAYCNNLGIYGGSDWAKGLSDINKKWDNQVQTALGDVDREIWKTQVETHVNAITNTYQLDKQNVNALAGLTDMTIYEAAQRYGMKAQEVADFRKALYELANAGIGGG